MLLTTFPPLTGLVVNLKFLRQTQFNLNHEMAVDAFLRHLLNLGEDYTKHFSIITPENGRLYYREADTYRFVILAQGNLQILTPIWQKLITLLQRLPESAPVLDKGVSLKDNVKLIGLQDYFDGIPLTSEKGLDAYTLERATEQGSAWFKALGLSNENKDDSANISASLHWTWNSTVRLLKDNNKDFQGEQRFCRDAQHITPYLLLKRTYETLSNINASFGTLLTADITKSHLSWLHEQSQFLAITQADVYWIDTPYFSKNKQKNTLGGMVGNFSLKLLPGLEPGILSLLIQAQTVGIGQRRASGLGKFILKHTLKNQYLGLQAINVTRSQTLLAQMLQPPVIARAINETEQKPNIDKLTGKTHAQIQSAIGQLTKNDYHPPVLHGFSIPKKDGTERLLAVSPLYDRILQKAASIVLCPGLDAMMSQCSYGFRKGLSRQQVRYDIQNAYREGYKWVYESDIDDFFDSISRNQLISRLQALYGKDPLWTLLESWLGQSIHYKNTHINRAKGVPQGSPLSPLLANFILDSFDSDLEMHGFKIIRYADDFIILCKTQHQAQLAAEQVKESLVELNLSLNADKTHIVDLNQGFQFLGYLFRNDHAIEIGGTKADGRTSYGADSKPKNLPPWLANLGQKQATQLEDDDSPKQQIGNIENQGTHLVLAGDAQLLTTDNHNLIVKKDDIITHKLSWEQIHAITLIGLHHMTLPAQHQALKLKIPVHMANRIGQYLGALTSFTPAQNNYKNWFIQLQMSDNTDYALQFAKSIVSSRVNNQYKTLQRRKQHRKELQPALDKLKKLQYKIKAAKNLASLNGYEGSAARLYFQHFNLFLPQWAQFTKRTRRPPKDEFNVLLSLGYTILYSHVDSILQSAGFMTWKGIYHQNSPAHAALASDIMESYRHIIERNAIHQINQGSLTAENFRQEKDELGQDQIRLSAEARRRYVTSIINRFQKFSANQTLHQHLYQQAQELMISMKNQTEFKAWKETK